MKFGKEFKNQMIPEWIEAYMDYSGLKQIFKDIGKLRQNEIPSPPLYRSFSGLVTSPHQNVPSEGDIENQTMNINSSQEVNVSEISLGSPEELGDEEILFVQKFEHELDKVDTFYKNKVEEVMKDAAVLNKQMDALVALRVKVKDPNFDGSSSLRHLSMDIEQDAPLSPGYTCKETGCADTRSGVPTKEFPSEQSSTYTSDVGCNVSRNGMGNSEESSSQRVSSTTNDRTSRQDLEYKPAHVEILEHVKIKDTHETPVSTLKGIFKNSKKKDLRFKREELKEAGERLKQVFIEFYQKLRLLKHYSSFNLSAFFKILKKYEKVTSRSASKSKGLVYRSYLENSNEIAALMNRVEKVFVKHFSNSNRKEGMKILRPRHKQEKHRVTFFSGYFCGCSFALLAACALLIRARNLLNKEEATFYMEFFPLYSFYAYIILHMFLYAVNTYLWRHYRINYPFIYGFKQGTELGFREVFLLTTGFAVLVLATFLVHLHIKMDSRTQHYEAYVEILPLALLIVVIGLIFCPLNILFRSSRFFFIKCFFRSINAPLYKVTLADFFVADQLTSQVQAFRCVLYYVCYYGWREYSKRQNRCHNNDIYNVLFYVIPITPYWFRFLQCMRRLSDDRHYRHGLNGLRYLATIIAVAMATTFKLRKKVKWKVMAFLSSSVSVVGNTYWDIVVDWGLLQRKSKNLFLRDKLSVPHKSSYFAAMSCLAELVFNFNLPPLQGQTLSSVISCLEILRRGMWNFFRLENEHLNNVGKYRVSKPVPLPFVYHED